jgi:hypothetical protein
VRRYTYIVFGSLKRSRVLGIITDDPYLGLSNRQWVINKKGLKGRRRKYSRFLDGETDAIITAGFFAH